MDPVSSADNAVVGLRFQGGLDKDTLQNALDAVVLRHTALRTVFSLQSGEPVQVVQSQKCAIVSHVRLPESGLTLHEFVEREAAKPFDLSIWPLFRPYLIELGPDEYVFALVLHHIIGDGWSCEIFVTELSNAYNDLRDRGAVGPRAPVYQYTDFALAQRDRRGSASMQEHLQYWVDELAGAPARLDLPFPGKRSDNGRARGGRHDFQLTAELSERVKKFASAEKTTVFAVLLSALQALLMRYTGSDDVQVASPVANRLSAKSFHSIGYFSNTIVLRASVSDRTRFRDLVRQQHRKCMNALAHQELPFQDLVTAMKAPRDPSAQPLAQVMFALHNPTGATPAFRDVVAERVDFDGGSSSFDLVLWMRDSDQGLRGCMKYRVDLCDADFAAAMCDAYERALQACIVEPDVAIGAVDLVRTDSWKAVAATEPFEPIHQQVDKWARLAPDAVAMNSDGQVVTYRQLTERSSAIANSILTQGCATDRLIGICTVDPVRRTIASLGVLKTGAAFLWIDPSLPLERLRYMVADAGLINVLCDRNLQQQFSNLGVDCIDVTAELPTAATVLGGRATPAEEIAYAIYTSGSTGQPKGVMLTHAGIANVAANMTRRFTAKPGDNVLQFASQSFDASVLETVLALTQGATLHFAHREDLLPGQSIRETLRSRRITHTLLPPSLLATIEPDDDYSLKCLIVGGEACAQELADAWAARFPMFNAYGPTEITIFATLARIAAGGRISIGTALEGACAYVVDKQLRMVPIGVPGEILLGGVGVARGYAGKPDMTAERFIPHPFSDVPGERIYRTGDVGRLRADGTIEFLGRKDRQVKLNGYRIELDEVEHALTSSPDIEECAVVANCEGTLPQLHAFVRPRKGHTPEPARLTSWLAERLPPYMRPAAFSEVDSMPRTPSGKIDRQALLNLKLPRIRTESPFTSASTVAETVVSDVWRQLFGVDRVGRDDNFFDLGGNSLLLVKAQAELQRRLDREISIVEMFRNPTVASLARCIGDEATASAAAPSDRGAGQRLARARNLERRRALSGKDQNESVA